MEKCKKNKGAVIAVLLWHFQNERNNYIFNSKFQNFVGICCKINSFVDLWTGEGDIGLVNFQQTAKKRNKKEARSNCAGEARGRGARRGVVEGGRFNKE